MWQNRIMPVTPEEFRSALSRFASGVTIVTGRDASGELFGLTVSSFCSVSLDPPLVLICIQKGTACHRGLSESNAFAVNILSEEQDSISNIFASGSSEKFSSLDFAEGIEGVPLLSRAVANLECRKHSEIDGGDHTVFLGEVDKTTVGDDAPLIYWRGSYRRLGSR